ncbi:staygreen family protein [Caldibacillus lycopersici]|uniref:Staygreen family protein n=1 Tax=Perspicuibacillus lycopersici TaxID=1325689 RepID=A0AAE3IW49_9BACI|nr:staygreen family protein [Perspicuibacillus lycopersici]MCU9614703.1 staygreen family protein [Perspicuibacillus lycopersici]
MYTIDLAKLSVTMIPPATTFSPVDGRRYTLLVSEETGEFDLSIGHHFHIEKINSEDRLEIIAAWTYQLGHYILAVTVMVADDQTDINVAHQRFQFFQNNMNHGLQAIVSGDNPFYQNFPWLQNAPIYVNFESVHPQFKQTIYYGKTRKYLNKKHPEIVL